MSITPRNPNTIYLGGEYTEINDIVASEAITPGHLVERFNNGGVIKFRKHATADVAAATLVAQDQPMLNKGVDDAYAAGDLVQVIALQKGAAAWMLIASGQNIVAGQKLQSAGDGTLKAYATAGAAIFTALENSGAVTTLTRLRVEVI